MSGRKAPLSDLDKQIIKKMYNAGEFPSKIAVVLDKSAQVVQRWVRNNIPPDERWYMGWVYDDRGFSKKPMKPDFGRTGKRTSVGASKAKTGKSAKPSKRTASCAKQNASSDVLAIAGPVAGPSSAKD